MTDKPDIGTCEHCGGTFPYRMIHNGFNQSTYAYCDSCGITALLDGWGLPDDVKIHAVVQPEDENLFLPCDCGGTFKSGACPQCPHCQKPLSAKSARSWLEANALGTAKGWRWQCSWIGLYAIVIQDRLATDKLNPEASNNTSEHIP